MKLRTFRAETGRPAAAGPRFAFREPLLALSLAIPLLIGCRSEGRENPSAYPANPDNEQVEIPHFIPPRQSYAPAPTPTTQSQPELGGVLPALSDIIAKRVAQESPKMKLTASEAQLIESYLKADLPSMQPVSLLASRMPKTAIELVRAVHERGVTRNDAEGIASYINRMLDSMGMARLGTFDECCSHVLGRRWDQIDYSGESLDSQAQERRYRALGVPDLLTAENVRKYFAVESKLPYFRKIFKPRGPLPEF